MIIRHQNIKTCVFIDVKNGTMTSNVIRHQNIKTCVVIDVKNGTMTSNVILAI